MALGAQLTVGPDRWFGVTHGDDGAAQGRGIQVLFSNLWRTRRALAPGEEQRLRDSAEGSPCPSSAPGPGVGPRTTAGIVPGTTAGITHQKARNAVSRAGSLIMPAAVQLCPRLCGVGRAGRGRRPDGPEGPEGPDGPAAGRGR